MSKPVAAAISGSPVYPPLPVHTSPEDVGIRPQPPSAEMPPSLVGRAEMGPLQHSSKESGCVLSRLQDKPKVAPSFVVPSLTDMVLPGDEEPQKTCDAYEELYDELVRFESEVQKASGLSDPEMHRQAIKIELLKLKELLEKTTFDIRLATPFDQYRLTLVFNSCVDILKSLKKELTEEFYEKSVRPVFTHLSEVLRKLQELRAKADLEELQAKAKDTSIDRDFRRGICTGLCTVLHSQASPKVEGSERLAWFIHSSYRISGEQVTLDTQARGNYILEHPERFSDYIQKAARILGYRGKEDRFLEDYRIKVEKKRRKDSTLEDPELLKDIAVESLEIFVGRLMPAKVSWNLLPMKFLFASFCEVPDGIMKNLSLKRLPPVLSKAPIAKLEDALADKKGEYILQLNGEGEDLCHAVFISSLSFCDLNDQSFITKIPKLRTFATHRKKVSTLSAWLSYKKYKGYTHFELVPIQKVEKIPAKKPSRVSGDVDALKLELRRVQIEIEQLKKAWAERA